MLRPLRLNPRSASGWEIKLFRAMDTVRDMDMDQIDTNDRRRALVEAGLDFVMTPRSPFTEEQPPGVNDPARLALLQHLAADLVRGGIWNRYTEAVRASRGRVGGRTS